MTQSDDLLRASLPDALDWLDHHFQFQGRFAASAQVQRRAPEMTGLATLLARYKLGLGAHEDANRGERA